jgi:hypothetical protein
MPLRDLWRPLFGEEAPEFFTEEELMGDLGPRLDRLIGNFLDNTLKDGARGTSHPLWKLGRVVSDPETPRFMVQCGYLDLIRFVMRQGEKDGDLLVTPE